MVLPDRPLTVERCSLVYLMLTFAARSEAVSISNRIEVTYDRIVDMIRVSFFQSTKIRKESYTIAFFSIFLHVEDCLWRQG